MTSDHIKSHLQKFRMNTKISHDLFMQDYEQAREDAEARFAEHIKRSGSQAPPVQFSAYPVTLSSPQAATCATCQRYAALFELGVGVPEEGLPAHSHAAQQQSPQPQHEQQPPPIAHAQPLAHHGHAEPGAPDAPASCTTGPLPPVPPAAAGAVSGHLEAQLAHLQSQLNELHQQTSSSSAGTATDVARAGSASSSSSSLLPVHVSESHGKDVLPSSVSAALESAQAMRVELGETIGRFERETSRLFDEVLVSLKRDGSGSSAAASAAAAAATALGSSRTGPSDAPLTYLGLLNSLAKPHAAEASIAGSKALSAAATSSATSIAEQFCAIQRQMGDQLRIEKAIRKRHEGQLSLHGASIEKAPEPDSEERLEVSLTAAIEAGGEAGLLSFFALRFSLDAVLSTQTLSTLDDGQTISGVVPHAIAVGDADRDPSACLRFLLPS